ncbi:MAG: bifunctional diguanylate cyclase/phosphodiesterase [Desulfobacterales bacterium]
MKKIKNLRKPWRYHQEPGRSARDEIKARYQPIVNLSSGETIGWEAFTRIKNDDCFRFFFDVAADTAPIPFSPLIDVDCFENAIQSLGQVYSQQKIFLNIQPHSFRQEIFNPLEMSRFLDKNGIQPYQVVFEISSRNRFQDDSFFRNQLDPLRKQGIQFALDNVGSGQSDFRWIADLKPDYIKIDRQFYQNLQTEKVLNLLVESVVSFSNQMNICVIAGRLENLPEIEYLVDLGIQYGQGYYFARPDFPKKAAVPNAVSRRSRPLMPRKKCQLMKYQLPIGKYATPVPIINQKTSVEELRKSFDLKPVFSSAIVVDDGKPVGIVTDQVLYRIPGFKIGISVSKQIDLAEFMERNFLVFESQIPTANIIEKVLKPKPNKDAYSSHIIVASDGNPLGIVSVEALQDVFVRYQIDEARDASPLTGLPGNMAIRQAMDDCYRIGHPISLIYVDLDHFKAYNDQFGFEKGDRVLLQLSQILSWAIRRKGGHGDFLGHIGGDDFVIITKPEHAVGICQLVIRSFSRITKSRYDTKEIKQGYVIGLDREKTETKIPLVSVSLAIVDCNHRSEIADLSERAATMKRYAKTISGNAYVFDRRKKPD